MALVLKDRVRVTSSTTGTGTFTLGIAASGFQDFSVIGDGNTTYYTIQNSGDNTWEVGIGTYTSSGTTLSRDTVLESSNSGSLVNFGAGTKDVFVTYPAEKGIYQNASGVANLTSTDVTTALGYTPVTNARTLTINGTSYDLTANRTWSVGTVTSVAALTLGTTGTDVSSSVADGTTTPVITLNIPTASATNRGALSSTDWTTFNNKGTVTSVSWTGGIVSVATATTTPAFTIAGTSGGIPYFSSGTTWASSGALAANALVIGGGAGAAPATTTTGTGVITALGVAANGSGGFVTDTGTVTLTNKTLTGTKETVFTITDGAAFEVDPANGGLQIITLGANRTPKGTNFTAGQSVALHINDGTAYTITWTDSTFGTGGVIWVGGTAPTLATTGYTIVELWKIGTQVYGALVGSVA